MMSRGTPISGNLHVIIYTSFENPMNLDVLEFGDKSCMSKRTAEDGGDEYSCSWKTL